MSTTAAPSPTLAPAGRGIPTPGITDTPGDDRSFTQGADSGETHASGFRAALVLAVLLTVPAVYLVGRGDLSAHDALVRFGCAWAFATAGVALVRSTVGGGSKSSPASPGSVGDAGAA